MRANSLALRLFLSATAWTVIILVAHRHRAVVALSRRGRARVRPPARRLSAHAGRRCRRARRCRRSSPQSLGEPLFELPLSGWYWQVTRLDAAKPEVRVVALAVGLAAAASRRSWHRDDAADGTRQGYVRGAGGPAPAPGRAHRRSRRGRPLPGRGRGRRAGDRRRDARLRPRAGRHLRGARARAAAHHHVPGALRPRAAQAHFGEPRGDPLRHGRAAGGQLSRSRSRRSRARPTR